MKVAEFEKIYGFSFDEEMEKKRQSMLDSLEYEDNWDENEKQNKEKLRNLFIQVMNSSHKNEFRDLFDVNFHESPFGINKNYDNMIDYVDDIENYIDRILYNILDDGELYFVKCYDGKRWGFETTDFFFSDYDFRENDTKLKYSYGDNAKFKSIYIGSIDKYIEIVSELLNEQNYYESKDLETIFFENKKSFDKYFENK